MKKNRTLIYLTILILPVFYFYTLYSGIADKSRLTSKIWHSTMSVLVADNKFSPISNDLKNINLFEIISDIRYLVDGTYIQQSEVKAYVQEKDLVFSLDISNVGNWNYEQGYLFLESGDIKNILVSDSKLANEENINEFKDIFLIYMLETRKMDSINENMMLMTSVDNNSRLWVAN